MLQRDQIRVGKKIKKIGLCYGFDAIIESRRREDLSGISTLSTRMVLLLLLLEVVVGACKIAAHFVWLNQPGDVSIATRALPSGAGIYVYSASWE